MNNGLVKIKTIEALTKVSLKRSFVIIYRPEIEWANQYQNEI
jgi:hypothetical protein